MMMMTTGSLSCLFKTTSRISTVATQPMYNQSYGTISRTVDNYNCKLLLNRLDPSGRSNSIISGIYGRMRMHSIKCPKTNFLAANLKMDLTNKLRGDRCYSSLVVRSDVKMHRSRSVNIKWNAIGRYCSKCIRHPAS